ncbi:hypothetical protein ACFLSP_03110 [Bacteroidota bacterium]
MKYIDTGKNGKTTESWSFLIEPEEMLADRLNMIALKNDKVNIQQTDTTWTNNMSIFQFMIGNADYSVRGRHNVKLLRFQDPMKSNLIPVPYDFDYCGLVNAHYAIPGETLGISSVKERYFLGPCRTKKDYQDVINEFMSKKESILDLVNGFEYLSDKEKTQVSSYLEEFFTGSTGDRYIENFILSTCR